MKSKKAKSLIKKFKKRLKESKVQEKRDVTEDRRNEFMCKGEILAFEYCIAMIKNTFK